MSTAVEFGSKILKRQSSPEEYDLYRAALEWDLTDPITIESEEDFRSAPRWRDRMKPYYHQVENLMTFCRRLPVTLLADDVGLGKTISAGLVLSELIARGRLSNTLIVCPKLLGPQWQRELDEKFGIPSRIAIGRDLVSIAPDETEAIITTYNSARLYLEKVPEDRFQMLVLDEAHKLRNLFGTEKPPQVAKRFQKALAERRFQFVLMLTATPIQNRLWDIYSLVDLLAVARGHQNPFGSEGLFVRKFIADRKDQARELKPESQEEFRSIVYGYMSRIRRGDANLSFPERVVQLHTVAPTQAELELIKIIAKPIQDLNILVQISILQALVSSPDALSAQLQNMARKGSVPIDLATRVKDVVSRMPPSAKLNGLGLLIDRLKAEHGNDWRLIVFTGRLETQTTIQSFLESRGLKVGIINGSTGPRNQETLSKFWSDPPGVHVIVSTEAGSEGVNLQVANILVNYDLPWNPMIVEQRIGRVQRLNSKFKHVSIFNITLKGTFEEYIVGRLMQKLQMASHAIGDIEALLEGADIGGDEDDLGDTFERRILKLVLAALAGEDVTRAATLAEQSIERARAELEREEQAINSMLGGMDGAEYVGPRAPTLPSITRSMSARDFAVAALESLGVRLSSLPDDIYLAEAKGHREYIRFDQLQKGETRTTGYVPGSPAFRRLTGRMTASALHAVEDVDEDHISQSETVAKSWLASIGASAERFETTGAVRHFSGRVLLRVKATVAHDSYERLIEVPYDSRKPNGRMTKAALASLPRVIERIDEVGMAPEELVTAAEGDEGVSEFCRFYMERREHEVRAAGSDERKRKKLEDEFTPRLEVSLVGLQGSLHRAARVRALYRFDSEPPYETSLTVVPSTQELIEVPPLGLCASSGRTVPVACLHRCEATGATALRHLLVQSETSGRLALPEFTTVCALSGKTVLADEVRASDVTGAPIRRDLLLTSAVSGRKAEPEFFGTCHFTSAAVLHDELATSELSGHLYRSDEKLVSSVSGRAGHKQEFVTCHVTRRPVAIVEAETCDVTGATVRPGILRTCERTGRRALPDEMVRSAVSGRLVLKSLLVASDVSGALLLPDEGIRSAAGKYCTPTEGVVCIWSGQLTHPDDMRTCVLSGLPFRYDFIDESTRPKLKPIWELLSGTRRNRDEEQVWPAIASRLAEEVGGTCVVFGSVRAADGNHLAVTADVRKLLGLRTRQVGFVYSRKDQAILGRIAHGKHQNGVWKQV